jgi:hypothetical protein
MRPWERLKTNKLIFLQCAEKLSRFGSFLPMSHCAIPKHSVPRTRIHILEVTVYHAVVCVPPNAIGSDFTLRRCGCRCANSTARRCCFRLCCCTTGKSCPGLDRVSGIQMFSMKNYSFSSSVFEIHRSRQWTMYAFHYWSPQESMGYCICVSSIQRSFFVCAGYILLKYISMYWLYSVCNAGTISLSICVICNFVSLKRARVLCHPTTIFSWI